MTTNSISSSLEIMRLRSGSFKCSSANSAYTLANIGNESDVENEEEKDYIVFDPNFLKKNGSKQTEGEKTYESTTNTLTTKMIFEDDNPVFLLMKSIIPFCSQVKHCKF